MKWSISQGYQCHKERRTDSTNWPTLIRWGKDGAAGTFEINLGISVCGDSPTISPSIDEVLEHSYDVKEIS